MASLTNTATINKEPSFEEIKQLAEQGDANSQFKLALIYRGILRRKFKVKQDATQADEWIKKAAEAGHPDAQYDLGVCYSKGFGVEQNYAQAVYWHKKAAEQGNRHSQGILGFYYYSEQDYQQAVEWFRKAAEQDDYFAQYRLACCYRDGVGVEQNNQLTFEWFNKCAESYANFGRGRFLKSDDSFFYEDIGFLKDSLCGDIYYRLANCYLNGVGVEINPKKGFEWLEKAAGFVIGEQYSVPANVDCFYDKDFLLSITYGESEKKLIQQWVTESHQGNIETQYRLAVTYFENNDYSSTLYYLNDALINNHPAAHQWLEEAYLHIAFPYLTDRADAEQYYQAAFEYCSKEANQESNEVSFCLGVLYACGKGVEQNKELASRKFYWILNNTGYHLNPFHGDYDELQLLAEYYLLVTNYYDKEKVKAGNQFLIDYVEKFSEFLAGVLSKSRMLNHPVLPSFTMKILCEMGSSLSNETGDFDSARKMFSSNRDRMLKEAALLVIDKEEQLYKKNKELEEKNKQLEENMEKLKAAHKALHEKEKEMLSFFTHTMRNALATAPESLRQAIRLLGSEDYEKNQKHYEAINEITSLFSTISLVDCLIDTFKQSIYDTEEFKRAWQEDNTGNATPYWFIAAALRQSLNRIIFMEDATRLRALLANQDELIDSTRKAFIEQVLPLDVNQRQQDVTAFYQWLESITAVEITIEPCAIQFGAQQVKFSLLFAISSELILNALKYWSGTGKIQVHWLKEAENYVFSVKNPCKASARSRLAGTHKGLAFIKRLIELLGEQAQFNCAVENGLFCAELKLNQTLLENQR